nr:sulfurtransferase TusA family protein [Sphingomonas japonica]
MIDARGLQCPWPALRLARILRESKALAIEIVADDPNAAREIAAVAAAHSARLAVVEPGRFRVER